MSNFLNESRVIERGVVVTEREDRENNKYDIVFVYVV